MRKLFNGLFLATMAVQVTTAAQAQLAVQMSCYSDMKKLCPSQFAARDRDKMRMCLKANLAKASQECQNAFRKQMAIGQEPIGPHPRKD